jgi:hypothetical protein
MIQSGAIPVSLYAAEIVGVGLLWLFSYRLNEWLFPALQFSANVSWIFLPAALRVLAVLMFSWRGALGLFLGSWLTYMPHMGGNVVNSLALCTVSALAPLVAVWFTGWCLKVRADLQGLNFRQLAILCCAGAFVSAFAHTLLFMYQSGNLELFRGFFPMFAGDLLGTLLVVYAAHFAMRLWRPFQGDKRS